MRALLVVVSGVVLGSAACGYADPISQSRWGGVLALQGDEELAMKEAVKLMRDHCGPDNFEVDRIEEVVVDEEDYVHTESGYEDVYDDAGPDDDDAYAGGVETTDTFAGTTEIIETHVTYRCLVPVSPYR